MRVLFFFTVRLVLLVFVSVLSLSFIAPAPSAEPKGGPPEFKRLEIRNIGPAAGGRVARSCGVPGDPLTYYAATAAGGVWKSTDGGVRWKAVFDDQPIASIGSIAVAASDPNVVYVGSGEANIRGNVQPGNGIYKSTDAGKTWKHVWQQEGQIGTMIVLPKNPDVAYAAVLGHAFGPNDERGVYRTKDGGKTWERVLFKDRDTGASDVCFDPNNPRILFAGLWQARRRPWDLTSGGPGSGLYRSDDSGDTWKQLVAPPDPDSPEAAKDAPPNQTRCEGLPEGIWGKICVAVAPSDSRRVYAMIEAEKGGLFRSDDGGESWSLATGAKSIRQRAWYFSTFTVHPKNADVLFFPQVPMLKSIDGGKTIQRVKGAHHGDHHDLWIDPQNPDRMIDSNDGGVDITTNGGETWFAPPLPIAQFYHVGVDTRLPYHVGGPMQDIGTAAGPTNSLTAGGIRLADWYTPGGGETGFTAFDPSDPNIVYAGEYGGFISRYDHRTRQAKSVGIYPYNPSGHGAEDLRYRFQWTAPILVSPHDPKMIYHAANVLFKSSDGGETWKAISPDLTRNDKSKQKWAGGPITGDNTGVEVYDTIFAIAESPLKKDLLWAGTDDGLVQLSRDGGKNWTNVTPNIKGLPDWGTVCCIEPSPFDAETAYVIVDAHKLDDMKPYLFKTADGGRTWTALVGNVPPELSFLRSVRVDPKKKGMLYLGCERGLAYSTDDGGSWKRLKLNFPTVAVTDLVVKDNDLVIATNGRSLWVFDDLTPLREMTPPLLEKKVHLFPVQEVRRYRYSGSLGDGVTRGALPNPPAGAIIHYTLKQKPKDDLTLEVLNANGDVLRKFSSKKEEEDKGDEAGDYADDDNDKKDVLPTEAGLHRFVWDLQIQGATPIKRAKVDTGNPKEGALATPGKYTVKLTADGETVTTEVVVLLDPRQEPKNADALKKSLADLDEQQAFALKLRTDLNTLAKTVEQLRSVRKQLQDRNALVKDDMKAAPLVKASEEVVKKLDALEEKLHNPKAKVAYDILAQKGGAQLYSQLAFLWDLLNGSDGPVTQGMREVYQEQQLLLVKYDLEWKLLVADDLAKLNETAKNLDIPGVILPAIGEPAKKP
jgi:photosystem II stability/assembly factor-like uncharacterized protein